MTVRDLLEIYQIKNNQNSITALWEDMDVVLDSRIDTDLLFDSMLEIVGTLTPRYTETTVFQKFSENFFNRHAGIIARRLDVMSASYNPINDYDITVDESTDTEQSSTAVTTTNATNESESTSEHTTSAYDASTYQPRDKNTINAESTNESVVDGVGTMAQGVEHDKHESGRKSDAQTLIYKELDIIENADIYAYIADRYSRILCLNVF